MSTLRIAGFAGSFSTPSKSRALVEHAAQSTARRFGGTAHVFDLNDLGPSLPQARSLADLDVQARRHLDSLFEADALIVGTPVYKGSYTGIFKHLFDLLDPAALLHRPVLLTATGGGDKHALVIEHQLRPLFAFFEAQTLGTGIYATDRDFTAGRLSAEATIARLDRAIAQFGPLLNAPPVLARVSHLATVN